MAKGTKELKTLGKFFAAVTVVCGLMLGVAVTDAAPVHAAVTETPTVVTTSLDELQQTEGGGYTVMDGIYNGQRGRWVIFHLSGNMYFLY